MKPLWEDLTGLINRLEKDSSLVITKTEIKTIKASAIQMKNWFECNARRGESLDEIEKIIAALRIEKK